MKKIIFGVIMVTALALAAYGNHLKSTLKDGEYTAIAEGYGGDMEIKLTVGEGKISNVEVVDHSETPGISDTALEEVPAKIVETQATSVDAIAGSTVTSMGIMNAATEALAQAR